VIAIQDYNNVPDLINHINHLFADLYLQIKQNRGEVGEAKLFGNLNANGHRFTNLPIVPLGESDAITKYYFSNNPSGYGNHAAKHQDGGVDEINVEGLSGLLDDLQSPLDHTHQSSGGGVGGELDHGLALNGLLDDDHTQYALLLGRSGGQTLIGGTDAADDLILQSTSDASKGRIVLGNVLEGIVYDEDDAAATIGGGSNKHDINGVNEKALWEFHQDGSTGAGGTVYHRHSNDPGLSSDATFLKSSGDHDNPTVVSDGEQLGHLRFAGHDGTDYALAAEIAIYVDGTPGNDDMPGRIVLSTSANGAQTPTERMRINQDGTTSFNDNNITNIGDIALDTISSDDGSSLIVLTPGLQINTATANNKSLIIKTTDDNLTNRAFEFQDSGGTGQTWINARGDFCIKTSATYPICLRATDDPTYGGILAITNQKTDGRSVLRVVPSGTDTRAILQIINSSDQDNTGIFSMISRSEYALFAARSIGTPLNDLYRIGFEIDGANNVDGETFEFGINGSFSVGSPTILFKLQQTTTAEQALIEAQASTVTPLNIKAAASQSAPFQTWTDSSDNIELEVSSAGALLAGAGNSGVLGIGGIGGSNNNTLAFDFETSATKTTVTSSVADLEYTFNGDAKFTVKDSGTGRLIDVATNLNGKPGFESANDFVIRGGSATTDVFLNWNDGRNIIFYDGGTTEILKMNTNGSFDLASANKVLLRDSAIGIYSQADGYGDLFADTAWRIGNSSAGAPTTYLAIEPSADTYFVGSGAGFPFGHAYGFELTQTITVASADTWYELTAGLSSGNVNNVTFGGNHYLSVDKAGMYNVEWSASIETNTADQELMGSITVNSADHNVALNSESTNAKSAANHATVVSANKAISLSGSAILSLSATDQVSLIFLNKTLATDIVVEHAVITLSQKGS
jgi:hypothetical protein